MQILKSILWTLVIIIILCVCVVVRNARDVEIEYKQPLVLPQHPNIEIGDDIFVDTLMIDTIP